MSGWGFSLNTLVSTTLKAVESTIDNTIGGDVDPDSGNFAHTHSSPHKSKKNNKKSLNTDTSFSSFIGLSDESKHPKEKPSTTPKVTKPTQQTEQPSTQKLFPKKHTSPEVDPTTHPKETASSSSLQQGQDSDFFGSFGVEKVNVPAKKAPNRPASNHTTKPVQVDSISHETNSSSGAEPTDISQEPNTSEAPEPILESLAAEHLPDKTELVTMKPESETNEAKHSIGENTTEESQGEEIKTDIIHPPIEVSQSAINIEQEQESGLLDVQQNDPEANPADICVETNELTTSNEENTMDVVEEMELKLHDNGQDVAVKESKEKDEATYAPDNSKIEGYIETEDEQTVDHSVEHTQSQETKADSSAAGMSSDEIENDTEDVPHLIMHQKERSFVVGMSEVVREPENDSIETSTHIVETLLVTSSTTKPQEVEEIPQEKPSVVEVPLTAQKSGAIQSQSSVQGISVEVVISLKQQIAHLKQTNDEISDALQEKIRQLTLVTREAHALKEMNQDLSKKFEKSETSRASLESQLSQTKSELQDKVASYEKSVASLMKEKDVLKKDANQIDQLLSSLSEKEQQLEEFMKEGEALSKKMFAYENHIKKLRAEAKEHEKIVENITNTLRESDEKARKLQETLTKVQSTESELKENFDRVNETNKLLASQLAEKNKEIEQSNIKTKELNATVAKLTKKIEDIQSSTINAQAQSHSAIIDAETRVREEMNREIKKLKSDFEKQEHILKETINDQRVKITRTSEQAGWREDSLRKEIHDLRERCAVADKRYEELAASVPNATKPLLRQIETLHKMLEANNETSASVQESLNEAIKQSQQELALAKDKEVMLQNQISSLSGRVASVEAQLVNTRQELSKATTTAQMEKIKCEEQARLIDHLRLELQSTEEQYSNHKRDSKQSIDNLQIQLLQERETFESSKSLLSKEKESLSIKVKEMQEQLQSSEKSRTEPHFLQNPAKQMASSLTSTIPPTSHHLDGNHTNMPNPGASSNHLTPPHNSEKSENVDRTNRIVTNITRRTINFAGLPAAYAEEIESHLRQRDGEVQSLLRNIADLEKTRDSLADELVGLTTKCEELTKQVGSLPTLKMQIADLSNRYSAALEIIGEKTEQLTEMQSDMMEMKQMYKQQIDILADQCKRLSS